MSHSDATVCAHRPQDPHFALPDQVSYIAYFKGNPETVVTERSPKWNGRDDPPIPGNGYYGVEVGNLHQAVPGHDDTLVVVLTCEGAQEQVMANIVLKPFNVGHQQINLELLPSGRNVPERAGHPRVAREEDVNLIRWTPSPASTYDLYRTDLADTLADGRPKRVYHRLTQNLRDPTFMDDTIDPNGYYGYLLIPRSPEGISGAHTMEGMDGHLTDLPISRMDLFTSGNVAVSRAGSPNISILNPLGETVFTLKTSPVSVHTVDRRDILWVVQTHLESDDTDQASVRIDTFSPGGKPRTSTSFPQDVKLRGEIRDLDVDNYGRLWLLTDRAIYFFNRELEPAASHEFETGTIGRSTSFALSRGRIAVTDPVESKVNLFRVRRNKIIPAGAFTTPGLQPWDVGWIRSNMLAVSDPFEKSVSIHTVGEKLRTFDTQMMGSLQAPRDLKVDRQNLYASDLNRIVILPLRTDLSRFTPEITFGRPGEATLSWRSAVRTSTTVEYWPEGEGPRVKEIPGSTRNHRITLEHLPPVSRINFSFSPPLGTIPPQEWGNPFNFATPLWERGKTAVLRLPLAVILHTHAVNLGDQPEARAPSTPLPPDEVERIRGQIDDAVKFYWHNSSMKIFLDVDFFTSGRFLNVSPFGEHPPPDPDSISAFLEPRGSLLSDYVGVVRIIAEQRYDPHLERWVIAGRGGGFTWGVNPVDRLPGASWWRATPAHEASGNDWLMTHEFHHQLDAAFHESDHREYPFNHFSPMEYTGSFGEHYDGNAYILREWKDTDWFLLKWGEALVVTDSDEDGIPDDDPRLPSDEKRLGSDPGSKDSDGDGIEDLEEVLLSNWVTSGVGEDWGGPVHLPALTNRDTDGDGIPDGKDPYPLYDLDPAVPRSTPTVDGFLKEGEWSRLFQMDDERGRVQVFSAWDLDFFYAAARITPPAPFHIQIDADTNGWFDGRDNLVFRFTPEGKELRPKVEATVFVCDEQPDRYPYMSTDLFSTDSIPAAGRFEGDEWVLEFAIPRRPDLGLTLEQGEVIGINAGCYFDSSLTRRVSLFEPHRLIHFRLTK